MGPVQPGDVLAEKYRVERVLGQGGMGYVVAARHLQLDQLVAMKFLRHGALDEGEATARFLREAKAAVKLKNEHVSRVYDVGILDGGEPYMVMEYLEGSDLSAIAKERGPLEVCESVEYVLQAAEALAEAHSLGIIHRDIKLANLFVTHGPAGQRLLKVLDFGISKTNPFGESEHDVTRTSSMLGSPRFMSPEQMRDPRAVDGRTDIWSLGVVLYRLVSGRAPFEADTLGRLLSMVMHDSPPPLSTARADLPPGFEAAVMRCLDKDLATRWGNVAELGYALAPFAADPTRARAQADRIAATLSVAKGPRVEISFDQERFSKYGARNADNNVHRPSGPPGAVDTGTAAPWAGTHGGSLQPKASRAPTIWAGVGLASVLLCAVLLAVVFTSGKNLSRGPAVGQARGPTAESTALPVAASAKSTDTPIVPSAQPTIAAADDKPKGDVPKSRPAWVGSTKKTTSAPGPGGGIPSTRE